MTTKTTSISAAVKVGSLYGRKITLISMHLSLTKGKNAGVIGVGGLVLARIPEEIVEQRDAHYRSVTENQMNAVDRDWMRESNAAMPKLAPQRSSKVTFGSKGQN